MFVCVILCVFLRACVFASLSVDTSDFDLCVSLCWLMLFVCVRFVCPCVCGCVCPGVCVCL